MKQYKPNEGQKTYNQGVSKAAFLVEASEENLCPSLFQLLKGACIPWLMAPSSFKASSSASSNPSLGPRPHPLL